MSNVNTAISPPSKATRPELFAVLVVLALVTYGSFFPFKYVPHEASGGDVIALLSLPRGRMSVIDIVGNVLLFLPLGALLASSRLKSLRWPLLGLSVAVALLIQYFQFWFPGRHPSALDALLNLIGLLLGLGLGQVALKLLARWNPKNLQRPQLVPIATFLMLLWVAYRWFPLVPTLDLQNVKNGLKPLLSWGDIGIVASVRSLAGWLVFLRLTRYSVLQRIGYVGMAAISLGVLAAQPIFAGNMIRPNHLAGCLVAVLIFPMFKSGRTSMVVLTMLLATSIALSALAPGPARAVQNQLFQDLSWVPFSGFLQGSLITNIASLIEKCFLYGSLLFFLRYLGLSIITACLLVVPALFALEWFQQSIPGRTPEITDPLLALLLASALYAFMPQRQHQAAHGLARNVLHPLKTR